MPIIFATPRTQSRQCLGAVIASADVERLDAACALAREAGLPGSGLDVLQAARSAAAALRAAAAAATAAAGGEPSSPQATAELKKAVDSFEALVAAHGGGRAASGRDLVAARAVLAAAAAAAAVASAEGPRPVQAHAQAQAQPSPPAPSRRAAAGRSSLARQGPQPQVPPPGRVAAEPQRQRWPPAGVAGAAAPVAAASTAGAATVTTTKPADFTSSSGAFDAWLAGKRAAEAERRRREHEASEHAARRRRAGVLETRAVAAIRRYVLERGWPSKLVVETVAAGSSPSTSFDSSLFSQHQGRPPTAAPPTG